MLLMIVEKEAFIFFSYVVKSVLQHGLSKLCDCVLNGLIDDDFCMS